MGRLVPSHATVSSCKSVAGCVEVTEVIVKEVQCKPTLRLQDGNGGPGVVAEMGECGESTSRHDEEAAVG